MSLKRITLAGVRSRLITSDIPLCTSFGPSRLVSHGAMTTNRRIDAFVFQLEVMTTTLNLSSTKIHHHSLQ